jgi:site-specific DNA recombinase
VNDVALGHMTRMRWNKAGQWIYSEDITHPPIVSPQAFAQAQHVLAGRRRTAGPRERMRTRHAYALGGLFACGLCDRKM